MSGPPTEEGPHAIVSATLRAGVTASSALLVAGLAWTAGIMLADRPLPPPVARDARTGAVHWNVLLLLAGLLVLMATPVARLVAASWYYRRAGQRPYAIIAAVVLVIVLASILLSVTGVVAPGG
ncbi:MAG: DUF1634 domain-containing protein [Chthonomonadales bacterium]|nr:DUF1634 domain-containing protein [Chthonomonadales bacterium]